MQILHVQFYSFHSLIILLNITVEFKFPIVSGGVLQRRAPLNTNDLIPNYLHFFSVVSTDS